MVRTMCTVSTVVRYVQYIVYTEKYREFQARFSLFSILFLTEQFRNGALSVTHQRMITITLRGIWPSFRM